MELLNALDNLGERISDSIQYVKAKFYVRLFKLNIVEDDAKSRTLLLSTSQKSDIQFTLTLDRGQIGHRFESSVGFSNKLLTLKTVSDLGDLCFSHKIALSGIDSTSDGKIKLK